MQRITCLAAGLVLCGTAAATPVDPTYLLSHYNLITVGDATSNGDIEGAMIVGGSYTGAAGTTNLFNNAAHLPAAKTSYIYGSNSSQMNIDNGGALYIGGANNGNINLNSGAKLQVAGSNAGNINGSSGGLIAIGGANSAAVNGNGATVSLGNSMAIVPVYAISDVVSSLTSYSASLAALSVNGSITATPNALTFAYGGSGQAVFAITAADLVADLMNANISFLLSDTSAPVVINVDMEGASWAMPSSAHFASATPLQNVVFNFYNGTGTTLSFSTMWEASILAMGSTVTNSTPIEGALAAYAFVGHGELHNYPLTTPPDGGGNENPPPSVPEPLPLSVMAAVLFGLYWLKRKNA